LIILFLWRTEFAQLAAAENNERLTLLIDCTRRADNIKIRERKIKLITFPWTKQQPAPAINLNAIN
jgi:hypothetical protein